MCIILVSWLNRVLRRVVNFWVMQSAAKMRKSSVCIRRVLCLISHLLPRVFGGNESCWAIEQRWFQSSFLRYDSRCALSACNITASPLTISTTLKNCKTRRFACSFYSFQYFFVLWYFWVCWLTLIFICLFTFCVFATYGIMHSQTLISAL